MIYLRQSTASQEIPLGYFVDSTDGNTEKIALTIANTDIMLWKNGATTLASKNSGGATHISNGIYYAVLDATDTDTIGPMVIFCHMTGALTTRLECCVLDEAVFDVLFGTTALSTYAGADTSGTTTLLTRLPSAITLAGGAVTVGTNNDKTGYSIGAGGISSTSFAANAIDSSSVATNTVQEVADGILLRKLDRTGDGTDAANERTVVNALRALRNKQSISAGTLTVTKEDDATTAWTAAVTTTAGDPLSSIDPT